MRPVPAEWCYDVWEALPPVGYGVFGRGVIALSESGARRVRVLAPALNDDLAVSEGLRVERVVVESASVVVHPPRTLRDLVRRRTRVVTGNIQADGPSVRGPGIRTKARMLGEVVRRDPRLAGKGCGLPGRWGHCEGTCKPSGEGLRLRDVGTEREFTNVRLIVLGTAPQDGTSNTSS